MEGLDDEVYATKLYEEFNYFLIEAPEELKAIVEKPPVPAPAPLLKWVKRVNPHSITLSNENMTATCTGGNGCSVVGEVSLSRFSVRVDIRGDNGSMNIGLVNRDHGIGTAGYRWYAIQVINGKASHWIGTAAALTHRDYTTPILNGDIITVIREGTSISFEKNGVSLGVALHDVPEDVTLHPLSSLWRVNQQITSV